MHRFIKASGFPDTLTEKACYEFLDRTVQAPENLYEEYECEPGSVIREYRLMMSANVGICADYLYIEGVEPRLICYFPFYETYEVTSEEECIIERHTGTETYSGIIDNLEPGISLIFFMDNSLSFRKSGLDPLKAFTGSCLSAFADEGKVLLPVAKNVETRDDDLYTLVSQTFIPWGVECDLYSIVGEIMEVGETVNRFTGVPLWLIRVICNGVSFRVCMRKEDLLGEPLEGRRIKCLVWLQGCVNLES